MNTVSYLDNIASYIKEKESWYLKRFGYAACELWFCVEACNILNFDHPLYSFEKQGAESSVLMKMIEEILLFTIKIKQ